MENREMGSMSNLRSPRLPISPSTFTPPLATNPPASQGSADKILCASAHTQAAKPDPALDVITARRAPAPSAPSRHIHPAMPFRLPLLALHDKDRTYQACFTE